MSSPRTEARVKSRSAKQKVQRLFFALWPDEAARKQLKQCQESQPYKQSLLDNPGSRAVFPGNFHITLAFLGNVDASQKACVVQIANGIQCPSFNFTLNRASHWLKPRIIVAGPDEMPKALVTLATHLRDGAIECGVEMDMRPYNAHVTLMRKIVKAPEGLTINPLTWIARRFVLIESTSRPEGVRYEVIQEWPLVDSGE